MSDYGRVTNAQLAYIADNPESASPDEIRVMAAELVGSRNKGSVDVASLACLRCGAYLSLVQIR